MQMSGQLFDKLEELARLYGVNTSYRDMSGCIIKAQSEVIMAVLRSLGAPVTKLEDVSSAIIDKKRSSWEQFIEPVIVIWQNNSSPFAYVRVSSETGKLWAELKLESGESEDPWWDVEELNTLESAEIGGVRYSRKCLPLPPYLPPGYHRLSLELNGKSSESLVIVAPPKAHSLPSDDKQWGVFLPLYALKSKRNWGSGDITDLSRLADWQYELGGKITATLPLLASYHDESFSPYTPVSRLFWDEFYIDAGSVPEIETCEEAKRILQSDEYLKELEILLASPLVDHQKVMQKKRTVLDVLARWFFEQRHESRFEAFSRYIDSNKELERYASFRAAGERYGTSWTDWEADARDGTLTAKDFSEQDKLCYLYSQFVLNEQLDAVSKKSKQKGQGLYIDLPLGVHKCGYDIWRERKSFACDASVGAPPDPVFTSGQNWNFPPMRLDKIREQGYKYFIDCVRTSLRYASILRIDHVMGFHRLFWIPEGMESSQGLYVGYPAEEFYAILTLESYRHKAIIVGEDLGLVPEEVRTMMSEHGLYRTYVAQYQLTSEKEALREVPERSVVSLNTHDMFPFEAYWQEEDITERTKLGLVSDALAKQEIEFRQKQKASLITLLQQKRLIKDKADAKSVCDALLFALSASAGQALLVNLEDLWGEHQPQNIPGTSGRNNWRKKARYSFEEFTSLPRVTDILNEINRLRAGRIG